MTMAFSNISSRTVNGSFISPDGTTPATGFVVFEPPSHLQVASAGGGLDPEPLLVAVPSVTATLDENGAFTVELLCTDEPEWGAATGWRWNVRQVINRKELPPAALQVPVDPDPLWLHEAIEWVTGGGYVPGQPVPIGWLSDVDTTGVVTGQALLWDGNEFVPGGGDDVAKWTQWVGTQAEYDAVVVKDPNTLYVVTG